jgi:hypothetical protein
MPNAEESQLPRLIFTTNYPVSEMGQLPRIVLTNNIPVLEVSQFSRSVLVQLSTQQPHIFLSS